MKTKIIIIIIAINCYLIISLFRGKNTISNFFLYKKKYSELYQKKYNLLKERYNLEQIIAVLNDNQSDADDVLDELLREKTKSSLPSEKIVPIEKIEK